MKMANKGEIIDALTEGNTERSESGQHASKVGLSGLGCIDSRRSAHHACP